MSDQSKSTPWRWTIEEAVAEIKRLTWLMEGLEKFMVERGLEDEFADWWTEQPGLVVGRADDEQ